MAIRSFGDMDLDSMDDANIPVVCFLNEPEKEGEPWTWTAVNFMPRPECCGSSWHVEADTKEELLAWVQEKVVPLYEAATNNLKKFGTNYYWKAITPMFYVEIVEKATGNIESRMGPMGERKADRTETGASINLNHDKFFTRIVPANSSDDRD